MPLLLIYYSPKLNPISIWIDYTSERQTYKQLTEQNHCSIRTIQRYIEKAPKNQLNPPKNKKLNIIMYTTFFYPDFGILVLMDSHIKKVIAHYIVRTEKDIYYKIALNQLREKVMPFNQLLVMGRRLLKDLLDTPTQMCHFHIIAMKKLRIKHKSVAEKD